MDEVYISLTMTEVNQPNLVSGPYHNSSKGENEALTRGLTRKDMKIIHICNNDQRLIWKLFKNNAALNQIVNNREEATVRKAVIQGCSMSPAFFNASI